MQYKIMERCAGGKQEVDWVERISVVSGVSQNGY